MTATTKKPTLTVVPSATATPEPTAATVPTAATAPTATPVPTDAKNLCPHCCLINLIANAVRSAIAIDVDPDEILDTVFSELDELGALPPIPNKNDIN